MNFNDDFGLRAVVDTRNAPWVPSPLAGVERVLLDRIGAEVARATSLVRYAAGSVFSAHRHGGGEEFLVLDGVFSDEHGDYGPGTYVRNPVGSHHAPFSSGGCTIFVKLWQMDASDQVRVRIDTAAGHWRPGLVDGLDVMSLYTGPAECVALVRWRPGTAFAPHRHPGGEEIFVLDGVFYDEQGAYPAGTWLRNPPGSSHEPYSKDGCLIYVKTGHLLSVSAPGV